MSAKETTHALQTKRRRRRQWITNVRMIRYGVNNFTRNAWLTIAATAVMTLTLLMIFMTVAAQNILQDSVKQISDKVDMSIYLKTETTDAQAQPIINDLTKLSSVKSVTFISSAKAREQFANDNKTDVQYLDAINEADNKFPATLRVKVTDINNTTELQSFVDNNENLKPYLSTTRKPSFAGDKRQVIERIGSWTVTAQRIGWAASIIFIILSSLIIFNTIRMAIFSRKEEIQMMKLIGADKRFIRGPFVVEAIMYGFIAALIGTGLGYLILEGIADKLSVAGIEVQSTLDLVTIFIGFVLLIMILLGALIGTVSSLLATRRYLKI